MASRNRQTTLRAARKYLRGAIVDEDSRASARQRIEGLPDSYFAGERVRSFVAVSSWFWYCYPCARPEETTILPGTGSRQQTHKNGHAEPA